MSRFCQGRNAKSLYLRFPDGTENLVCFTSVDQIPGPVPAKEPLAAPVHEVPVVVNGTDSAAETYDNGTMATADTTLGTVISDPTEVLGTSNTYGRCVLDLYEYVESTREQYHNDSNLDLKMKEIQKMIIGLSLRP